MKTTHTYRNQSGFEAVALLVVVLVLGVIGFGTYKFLNMQNQAKPATSTSASTSSVPATISSKSDLTTTSKALDDSSSQLDSGLDDTALDSDLNALL